MSRLDDWRQGHLDAVWKKHGMVHIETVPFRDRLVVYALRPVRAARYLQLRFRLWSAWPGDRFEDFQRDETYEVLDVQHWLTGRPRRLTALAHAHAQPPRPVTVYRAWPDDRCCGPEDRTASSWTLPSRPKL